MISIEDKRFYSNSGVDVRGIAPRLRPGRPAQRQRAGRLDDRAAADQERPPGPVAPHDLREAQGGGARLPALAQVVEGQDRHRLPQHGLLRQRRLRDRGRGRRPTSAATSTTKAAACPATSCASSSCSRGRPRCSPASSRSRAPTTPRRTRRPRVERRNTVLRQMLEQGYLTRVVYDESVKQALPAPHQIQAPEVPTVEGVDAGYFTSWVRQQVIERYGAARAFEGGLKIRTTLDLGLQRAAEQAVNNYLAYPGGPTASLVAIENSTGEVRAMVGGRDYNASPFNLATAGRAPARLLLQGLRPRRRARGRHLARLRLDLEGQGHSSSRTRAGTEKFVVHNDEDNYTGSNTLTGATAFSDNSIYAEVGPQSRHPQDRPARAPDGHHDAAVDEPRDDDRRPHRRRHAARHGPRLRDARPRRPARQRLDGARRRTGRDPGSRRRQPRAARAASTAKSTACTLRRVLPAEHRRRPRPRCSKP